MSQNPLLLPFDAAYNSVPFSKIKKEHFKPAFVTAIAIAKEEIQTIVANKATPSFSNTIEALDYSGELLSRISSIFFNLNSAETNSEIQKIAQEISPKIAEFSNDIILNKALFKRIKTVYSQKESLNLNVEQQTLLEKTYKRFSRNGANLNSEQKNKLREIDKKLSILSLQFGEHVLAETNAFELLIISKKELEGLPNDTLKTAAELATSKNKKGWIFTLHYPSYIPFITYAKNRELRKKISIAFGAKGFQNNQNNNEQIVLEISKLRLQRANILGFSTFADFVLEERMAKNTENVHNFLNQLHEKAKPKAIIEMERLKQFAKTTDRISTLQKWDKAYYSEKLKKQKFDLDDEKLKPYFKLENVLQGVFTIAQKLFDLSFQEISTIDTYHEDVKTYKVVDAKNKYVALFYADFFPREGKRNGAWMTSYKPQMIKNGKNERPHISIVCNFTKPTQEKPSLLTFNEVTTLFHEFGHALHGMLANTTYPSLSGTNVYWDFVELPSQLLENWCYEKEALELFATHYKTGEVLPMEYIDKIKKAATFLEAMQTERQISFGNLDMHWHAASKLNTTTVKDYEYEILKETALFPDIENNCMSTSFSHIFQGGYAAGYYSYKWAEVLDADAFEYFKENGIFNKAVATKFKDCILSKGGTENPMELYKRFRGRAPKPDALLKRSGLL